MHNLDDVLLTRLENIQSNIEDIKKHLERINGQTAENTQFRFQQAVINKILGAVGIATIGGIISILVKIW